MEEGQYKSMRFSAISIAIIFIGLIFLKIYGNKYSMRLRDNHVVLCGTVLQMLSGKGVNVVYSFSYQDKRYEFNESSPELIYNNYKKGNNNFLIAIENGNPENHKILSEDNDYLRYFIRPEDTINVKCH